MSRRRSSGTWKPPSPEEFTWYLWEEGPPKRWAGEKIVMLEDGTEEMLHRLEPESIIPGRTLWRPMPDSHSAPIPHWCNPAQQ